MADEFSLLDAVAQAELVRRGEVKPLELVEAAIARLERLDPELNVLVTRQYDRARGEAASGELPDGPLCGVPFLLKDLGAHLTGDPVYSGMSVLQKADWREPGEAYFAGKLRRAGLVTLGRTTTPELGLLPTTESRAHGATHNPWNLDHSPGGSSGGSAAAVAAGLVPAAHASDGGGSIRIPANHCGLVGLKPSRGRTSFGPGLGDRWAGFSAEGFVTRSVRDTAALLDIVSGEMPGDPYTAPPPARPYAAEVGADPGRLRIGLMPRAARGETHPDCVTAATAAAHLLESLGHGVEESHPDALDDPLAGRGFLAVITGATAEILSECAEKIGRPLEEADVEAGTWKMAEIGRALSAPEYVSAVRLNHAQTRRMASWWELGFDLLLTPTCALPPPPLGFFAPTDDEPNRALAHSIPFSVFTSPFNVTGQPAISLPLHWNDAGLPVGVQLVARSGCEDLLLRVAAQLEAAQPWRSRIPPVHASR